MAEVSLVAGALHWFKKYKGAKRIRITQNVDLTIIYNTITESKSVFQYNYISIEVVET